MTDRNLKDAMRRIVDVGLSDLAYNIGFQLKDADLGNHTVHWNEPKYKKIFGKRVRVGSSHRERQEPVRNWMNGHNVDYNKRWKKRVTERAGTTAYEYKPVVAKGGWAPTITFFNLRMVDIENVEFLPAEETPQGKPRVSYYKISNDTPHLRTEEYETEDEGSKERENTFGWLVSTEFEAATRISGGVGVQAEVSARLETRVEARGDSRFETRSTHREALRGERKVSPYGVLTATVTDQLTRLSQPVIVTGRLDCSVYIEAESPHGRGEWTSLGALFDTMRGFGGGSSDSRIVQWWGRSGQAVSENVMQKTFEPLIPRTTIELRPHDTITVSNIQDEKERPVPGREKEYKHSLEATAAEDDWA